MTPHDKRIIWDELKRLERDKANTCPVKEMSNRINYLETTLNDMRQDIVRLLSDVQDLQDSMEEY